ncbi:MAG: hypothetical protein Q4D38_11135 [Planctomycetia bacterium]|nr:hypothetical protein [Planctomycetia bacterium]
MKTRFMWDCDLAANTYKTPKSEGYCYKDGVQTGSEGFSYLESALTYNNGFTMDYSWCCVNFINTIVWGSDLPPLERKHF